MLKNNELELRIESFISRKAEQFPEVFEDKGYIKKVLTSSKRRYAY